MLAESLSALSRPEVLDVLDLPIDWEEFPLTSFAFLRSCVSFGLPPFLASTFTLLALSQGVFVAR